MHGIIILQPISFTCSFLTIVVFNTLGLALHFFQYELDSLTIVFLKRLTGENTLSLIIAPTTARCSRHSKPVRVGGERVQNLSSDYVESYQDEN